MAVLQGGRQTLPPPHVCVIQKTPCAIGSSNVGSLWKKFRQRFYMHLNDRDFRATITRCNLSPPFFCIDAPLLCEFESDKI